ncbi:TFIIB-type zinc ribbon-containing protein [Methylomagnum sp.]
MSQCRQCGAPLPVDSMVCAHCGTANEIDLALIHPYTVHVPETERVCPACEAPLRTIDLHLSGTFLIEQCGGCLGLFLDTNELGTLLELAVPHVHEADPRRLRKLAEETWRPEAHCHYRRCPVCREFMQRKNYARFSGVVVDRCPAHGIWLDATELRRLLSWAKAGGLVLEGGKADLVLKA